MLMLRIDEDRDTCLELGASVKGKHVGGMLIDRHAIRYTIKLSKAAIPAAMVTRVEIVSAPGGAAPVTVHTQVMEKAGAVALGVLEDADAVQRFRSALLRFGFPVSG